MTSVRSAIAGIGGQRLLEKTLVLFLSGLSGISADRGWTWLMILFAVGAKWQLDRLCDSFDS